MPTRRGESPLLTTSTQRKAVWVNLPADCKIIRGHRISKIPQSITQRPSCRHSIPHRGDIIFQFSRISAGKPSTRFQNRSEFLESVPVTSEALAVCFTFIEKNHSVSPSRWVKWFGMTLQVYAVNRLLFKEYTLKITSVDQRLV